MLGEGARTAADAERYEQSYADAIEAVGKAAERQGARARPRHLGQALGPVAALRGARRRTGSGPSSIRASCAWRVLAAQARHQLHHRRRGGRPAGPVAEAARPAGARARARRLDGPRPRRPGLPEARARGDRGASPSWPRTTGRRLMVRLVKGAYWDTEIKRAQVAGRPDYPVYTTKAATDLSYLVCAQALIDAAPAPLRPVRHPQRPHPGRRAPHGRAQRACGSSTSACTAWARRSTRPPTTLFGGIVLRAYAPVGGHEDLLPYLVRRLLENGANTSFVHALLDERVPGGAGGAPIRSPRSRLQPGPHPRIPLPRDLYGADRRNSRGPRLCRIAADRDAPRPRRRGARRRAARRRARSSAASCGRRRAAARSPARSTARTCSARPRSATPADIDAAFDAAAQGPAAPGTRWAARAAPPCCAPWPTRWRPTATG